MGYNNECTNSMFMMSQPKMILNKIYVCLIRVVFLIKVIQIIIFMINYIVEMWKEPYI